MPKAPVVALETILRSPLQYGSVSSASEDRQDLPRYVRITDILEEGGLSTRTRASVELRGNEAFILCPGDILFARTGATVGKTYLHTRHERPHVFAGYLIRARIDTRKALPEFVHIYTHSRRYEAWLARTARSGAQPNISAAEYLTLPVTLPTIGAQKEIVRCWQALEAYQDNLRLSAAEKGRFKRALMTEILTGSRRFPEFAAARWRKQRLGDLLRQVSRPVNWNDATEYALLSLRRRSGGTFLRERRLGALIKSKGLFEVERGDFLISRMQVAHGALGLVSPEHAGMYVSATYDVLRARDEAVLDIRFFDHLSRLPMMYRNVRLACHGVHIEKMTFSLKQFLAMSAAFPREIGEQRRIADLLDSMDAEEHLLTQAIDAVKQQKKALMDHFLGDTKGR